MCNPWSDRDSLGLYHASFFLRNAETSYATFFLFNENCVRRFKLTPHPIPPCIDRTYIKQQCSVCVRLFYFELSTAWVHVASLAIYRIEPSRPNGPDTGWAPGSWSVVHVVLVTSSSYSIEHRPIRFNRGKEQTCETNSNTLPKVTKATAHQSLNYISKGKPNR